MVLSVLLIGLMSLFLTIYCYYIIWLMNLRRLVIILFIATISCLFSNVEGQTLDFDISQIHSSHLKNVTSDTLSDTSLNEYYNNIAIIKSLKNKPEEALAFKKLGIDYNEKGNFVKAINCFLFSISVAESLNDTAQIISLYNLLAYSLNVSSRFKEAKFYTDKLNELLLTNPNQLELITLYLNQGHYFEKHDMPQKALSLYNKANQINKKVKSNKLQVRVDESIGSIYEDLEEYEKGGYYFKTALKLAQNQKSNDCYRIANITNNIGDYYRKTGKVDSAIVLYKDALNYSLKHDLKDVAVNNLMDLSKCYTDIEDYKSANIYLNNHIDLNEELCKTQIQSRINQLDIVFSLENKSREIELQKAEIKTQRLIRTLLLLLLLFAGLTVAFLLKSYRTQKKMNVKLAKQNVKITEQSEDLRSKTDRMKLINAELYKSQERIKEKSERLKDANENYKKINKEKDKLIDVIAHDLKSPLQAIMGFSSILVENEGKVVEKNKQKYIQMIDLAAKRVNVLVDNLLSWSRSQNNRLTPQKEYFNISNVVRENIKLFELNALQKKVTIVSNVTISTEVFADKEMITVVLRNLLSNAIKFSNEDSYVIIDGEQNNGIVSVKVIDSGVGIKQELVADLFKVGNQHRTFGTAGEKGTGLGLLICKEYIERNNGTIKVTSREGKGSTFSFSLPISSEPI